MFEFDDDQPRAFVDDDFEQMGMDNENFGNEDSEDIPAEMWQV